jgi:hypothetical protein
MAVVIGEIVTETVFAPPADAGGSAPGGSGGGDVDVDVVVRRAVERVLEVLRREWDR